MSKHLPALALMAISVSIVYSRVSGAYFCGYDDFAETQRAKFEDSREPSRMFTTAHFGTPKYRPIGRALSYITWHWGGGRAWPFRVRNLSFHLLAASMIYGIAWRLFGSVTIAAGAGLMFGLHPLANQSIELTTASGTLGYACLLASFLFFLHSLRAAGAWRRWLAASLGTLWIGLFIYEAVLIGFGLMCGYLWLWRLRGGRWPAGYGYGLAAGWAAALGTFFAVRHLFAAGAADIAPLSLALRNAAMYAVALLLPVDSVLANTVFGTPLPSEVKPSARLLAIAGLAVLVLLAAATWAARRPAVRARLKALDWPEFLFLAAAAFFALSPFLVFSGHPSETYLYLPVGLYAILLSGLLFQILKSKAAYAAVVSVLLACFTAGTWVKNERVRACGDTAERILSQLPVSQWQQGSWRLRLASTPDDPPLRRYGLYGYHGLATIEPKEMGVRAMEMALQVASGNEQIKADVVDAKEMARDYGPPGLSFWISPRGDVRRAAPPTAGR